MNPFPVGVYLFKVNNRNTRTRCEICSKLTVKTPERRQANSDWVISYLLPYFHEKKNSVFEKTDQGNPTLEYFVLKIVVSVSF